MRLSDQREFMKMLTGIAELHNKTLSAIQLEIYWRALISFELTDVSQALIKHHDKIAETLRLAAMGYHFRKLNDAYSEPTL